MEVRLLKIGMIVFILLHSVKNDVKGKRLNKKIRQLIKKQVKVESGNHSADEYQFMIDQADKTIDLAKDDMSLESLGDLGGVAINPGLFIRMLEKKHPGFLEAFIINEKDVMEYDELFDHHKLTLFTMMYTRRVFELTEEEKTVMNKEQIEESIKGYEKIAEDVKLKIRAKQDEIDNYEEDDTTAEQEELDILNEQLEEVDGIIENLELQMQEIA